jgi:hypothetical protein
MTNEQDKEFFYLTIDDDQVWCEFHGGKQVITCEDDMHQLLISKASEFGLSLHDLRVSAASILDFPEEATSNPATIALAHEIRDPDWDFHLGPKLDGSFSPTLQTKITAALDLFDEMKPGHRAWAEAKFTTAFDRVGAEEFHKMSMTMYQMTPAQIAGELKDQLARETAPKDNQEIEFQKVE